ncbi:MAG: c-type cytochrome [candidate division Zixibacteria bacterium]|nr:c-type cytochrome [candidate division Zixibacteria bacterium]
MPDHDSAAFPSPRRMDIPVEKRPYGVVFFVCSLLLALGTLWAVADEVIVRRHDWKDAQRGFNQYEYQMVAARRDSLVTALEETEKTLDPSQTRAGLTQEVAAARHDLAGNADYHAAQSELSDRELALFKVNRTYQFTKSIYDEKFYRLTEAKHAGLDIADLTTATDRLKGQMDSLLPIIRMMAAGRDSVRHRIEALEGPVDSLAGLLQGKTQEITRLNERLAAIRKRTIKVRQVVLSDYEEDEFRNPIIRVDRCQSCHLGINKPEFADAPQPYTTHPRRDDYFKKHPPDQFGCTPCHDGQGPALTVEDAHRPRKFWEHPMLAHDMVEGGCQKCHANRVRLDHAEELMAAQKKLRRWGCFGCHEIEGYNDLPKVAPRLDKIATKVTASWMYDWIKNPRNFRPDTRMPNFRLPDSEAVSIVSYLRSVSADKPGPDWPKSHPAGDPANGAGLVKSVGCLGCHQIDGLGSGAVHPEQAAEINHGPNLSRIGSKMSADWLFGWLKNPRAYNPDTRMPSLRLTDQEAADIVAYLLTLREDSYQPVAQPAVDRSPDYLVKQGEYWVRTYGCFGCHQIPGMENENKVSVSLTAFGAKDVSELFFGDATDIPQTWEGWALGKMTNSRRYETKQVIQRMPDFAMSDEDAHRMAMLLRSFDARRVFEQYREPLTDKLSRQEAGRKLVEYYNCTGCHEIESKGGDIRAYIADRGFQPPVLNGEGAKVQSDWLFAFLKNPSPIRPWVKVRMPTFGLTGPEITMISQYFMANSDVNAPFLFVRTDELDPKSVHKGRDNFETLKCQSCHVLSAESMPQRGAASLAPNLAMAHERLRPDWIVQWLTDPQKVDPGTNMPSFFYSEGQKMYEDADEQIEALRDYLLTLKPL